MAEYNLGTARGRIELDSSQMGRGIQGAKDQLGGLQKELGGFSSFIGSVGNSLADFGDRIVGVFTKATLVAGGAVAALVGASLWGGLNRVLDTEDARVQMQRMGVATKDVDKLLSDVDKTFQGTPFANPDGFNISSQLFASGVALDKIPPVLGNIADLAAHGNVPIDQMGSLFVRVAAQGKVTGQELNRLTDMNIPLTQLADAMGLSVSELRDMTSAGELTADAFFDGIASVEMFQGAAKAAGDTTRGAFTNIKTALASLGDKFLSPLFGENGHAVTAMKAIQDAVKGLGPAVQAAGERFAQWLIPAVQQAAQWFQSSFVPAVKRVIEVVKQVIDWIKRNEEQIKKILEAMGPAAAALLGLAVALSVVRKAFKLLVAATPIGIIFLLASALVYAWQNSEKFREIVTGAFEAVKKIVGPIIDFVMGLIKGFGSGNSEVGDQIAGIWNTLKDILQSAIDAIVAIFRFAADIVMDIWDRFGTHIISFFERTFGRILQFIQSVFDIIRGIFEVFAGIFTGDWGRVWEGIKQIWSGIWNAIGAIFSQIVDNLKTVLGGFVAVFTAIWDAAWTRVKMAWDSVWNTIRAIFITVTTIIKTVATNVFNNIKNFLTTVLKFYQALFKQVWNTIKSVVTSVVNGIKSVITSVFNAIKGFISGVLNGIRNTVSSVWNGIKSTITSVVNGIKSVITSVFNSVKSFMGNAAQGARTAVSNAFNSMRTAVTNTVSNLLDFVRGLPGRIIGALGNAGSMLLDAGKKIIQGLINGITQMAGKAVSAVKDKVLGPIKKLWPFSPAKEGPLSGKGDPTKVGRRIIAMLANGLRAEQRNAEQAAKGVIRSMQGTFDELNLSTVKGSMVDFGDLSTVHARKGSAVIHTAAAAVEENITIGSIILPNITDRSSVEELLASLRQAARRR